MVGPKCQSSSEDPPHRSDVPFAMQCSAPPNPDRLAKHSSISQRGHGTKAHFVANNGIRPETQKMSKQTRRDVDESFIENFTVDSPCVPNLPAPRARDPCVRQTKRSNSSAKNEYSGMRFGAIMFVSSASFVFRFVVLMRVSRRPHPWSHECPASRVGIRSMSMLRPFRERPS